MVIVTTVKLGQTVRDMPNSVSNYYAHICSIYGHTLNIDEINARFQEDGYDAKLYSIIEDDKFGAAEWFIDFASDDNYKLFILQWL